jgi:hypothetical protein
VTVEVHFARVFAPSQAKPSVGDEHQSWIVDAAERDRVATYLRSGAPILVTTALGVDQLAPARGEQVGMSYRTDGEWVWSDALSYYAANYGLAPEDGFYQHIRDRGYECPEPDDEAQDRALAQLNASWE